MIHGGFNADLVTEIKRAVQIPVIIVGRFTEPQYAELLVKQGRADLVAFGRQSFADPELPNKARNGQLETLAPCIGCLLGYVPNMFAGKAITCAVNPCVGREKDLSEADVSKHIVIAGGGVTFRCCIKGKSRSNHAAGHCHRGSFQGSWKRGYSNNRCAEYCFTDVTDTFSFSIRYLQKDNE